MLADKTDYSNQDIVIETVQVQVAASNDWHLALYCYSKTNQYGIFVGNITVTKIDNSLPKSPELEVSAIALDCTLTVKLPTETVGGDPIPADTEITATVSLDGTVIPEATVVGTPGYQDVLAIPVPTNGPHTFSAVATFTDATGRVLESEPIEKTITLIKAIPNPLPMGHVIMPDVDEVAASTIINANDDSGEWQFSDVNIPAGATYPGTFRYNYNMSNPGDDWVILPAWDGSTAGAHALTFDFATKYDNESLEVCWAYKDALDELDPSSESYAADVAALFAPNTIHSIMEYSNKEVWEEVRVLFTLPEAKDFVIAFHAVSPKYRSFFFVQNVKVDVTDGSMPKAPAFGDFEFDGGDGTVKVILPTKNLNDEDLNGTVYADILLDGEPYGEPVSGTPGQEVSVPFTGLALGNHSVTATSFIYNGDAKAGSMSCSADFTITLSPNFAYDLPVTMSLGASTYNNFIVVDNNHDGKTWIVGDDDFTVTYNTQEAMDDWFITPAVNITDITKLYDVIVTARAHTTSYPEAFEVYVGKERSVEGMTKLVFSQDAVSDIVMKNFEGKFGVDEPGKYYIGIHGNSAANMHTLHVSAITVRENQLDEAAPAAVTDLAGDGFEDGSESANISFRFPTLTVGGAELPADVNLTATVSSSVETKTVEGLPGSEASLVLNCAKGENNVKVVVANEAGDGVISLLTVRCGLDAPKPVVFTSKVIGEDNMSFTVTWDPVTEGVTGNHINKDNLSYLIFEYDTEDEDWYQLDAISECSYTYEFSGANEPLQLVTLGVQVNNAVNSNSSMNAASAVVGTPKTLPLDEDFADGKLHHSPLSISSTLPDGYWPEWSIGDPATVNSLMVSPNGHSLLGHTGFNRGDSWLGIPKFSTEGLEAATADFCIYTYPSSPKYTVTATAFGFSEPVVLAEIDVPQSTEGWVHYAYELPESLLGKKWVDLQLGVDFVGGSSAHAVIDSYLVRPGKVVAVDAVGSDAASVKGLSGAIEFKGFADASASVYRADGTLAGVFAIDSDLLTVPAATGIYVVNIDGKVFKVAVK